VRSTAVDDDELHALYERADLVVLPSRYESFGLVMVEAMMHARAQVSCAIGGIEEVVRHGIDGLLVPPAEPPALAGGDRRPDPAPRAAAGDGHGGS
jgi:glycosyltransferase involved in cell wall biosynthesis